jgi:hypothetical protein
MRALHRTVLIDAGWDCHRLEHIDPERLTSFQVTHAGTELDRVVLLS